MGYSAHVKQQNFQIREENLEAARTAVIALTPQNPRWVDIRYLKDSLTLFGAVACFGWYLWANGDGNYCRISFEWEKLGDERMLFDALAPYVEAGSYIEMVGEDGDHWRWVFDGQQCIYQKANLTWGNVSE
jgi:hypothetical protein